MFLRFILRACTEDATNPPNAHPTTASMSPPGGGQVSEVLGFVHIKDAKVGIQQYFLDDLINQDSIAIANVFFGPSN